jgi:hypothetical protein
LVFEVVFAVPLRPEPFNLLGCCPLSLGAEPPAKGRDVTLAARHGVVLEEPS